MDTETLTVLIVAKTRRGSGACVGAITADGRSVRLEAPLANGDAIGHAAGNGDDHAGMDYEIGDVWKLQAGPHPNIVPPHVETVVVYGKRRLAQGRDARPTIEKFMPPVCGGVEALYAGMVQASEGGALYICERTGVPSRSTLFWRPDRPLHLVESGGVRLHYCYREAERELRLAFVGFQEPLDFIPAGTIVRVSLAHWWRPREHPEDELRCYLQLSGWFAAEDEASAAPGTRDEHQDSVAGRATKEQTQAAHTAADEQVRRVLKEVFGYDSFRPLQEQIVGRLRRGQDTLAVMPTGAGKSLCYQLPALLWPRLTVVVSPLISLMQDQVEALHALQAPAAYLNSTLTYAEQRRLMEDVRAGEVKLLYMAPETLVRPEVLHLLDQVGVDCLAVDEAHCISSWGHDFRPVYRQLEPVRRHFAAAVCLAMTATAAPRVRADIKRSLGIADAGELVASFDRPNLFLAAQPRTSGERQLLAFLGEHRNESGIVYCATKRQVDTLAERLQGRGYRAAPYHAGMDDRVRRENQRAFTRDDVQIMVATVAFGMGINKSNVRFVVHYNMPSSVEAYYQEIGRSGRDGLRADCLLLYHMQDVQFHARMIDDGVEEERPGRSARLQAMLRFAQAHDCRRPLLLRYFGEETSATACGFCDNCAAQDSQRPQADVTEAAQKFLGCVQRTGEVFGAGHIIDILRGSQSRKVLDRRHDRLPAYATGKEHSAERWRGLVQQWLQQQLLEQDMEHGGLRLTEAGREVLQGQRQAFAEIPAVRGTDGVGGGHVRRQGAQSTSVPTYDEGLFEHLRSLRRELAAGKGLPPYMVFSDRALAEMAAYLPQTPEKFSAINGVGRAKLETYGEAFMAAISAYSTEHNLEPQSRPEAQPSLPLLPDASQAASSPPRPKAGKRAEQLGELFARGATLALLQESFGIKRSTAVTHLRDYCLDGGVVDPARLQAECELPRDVQAQVLALCNELGGERLTPLYETLQGSVSYEDLHLLRLVWLIAYQAR